MRILECSQCLSYFEAKTSRQLFCTKRCRVRSLDKNGLGTAYRKIDKSLRHAPERLIWRAMRGRCADLNNKDYGGRGIIVHPSWDKFENFMRDMGPRPSKNHSLDRIDNEGIYEPSNCRWATRAEQQVNRRNAVYIEWNGETKHVYEWADQLKIKRSTLYARILNGMSVEKAFNKKIRTSAGSPIVQAKPLGHYVSLDSHKMLADLATGNNISIRAVLEQAIKDAFDRHLKNQE